MRDIIDVLNWKDNENVKDKKMLLQLLLKMILKIKMKILISKVL